MHITPSIGRSLVAINGNEDPTGALSVAKKRYSRDVSLAICGRYFKSICVYPGSYASKPLYLELSSLAFRSRRRPTPCFRRQRLNPSETHSDSETRAPRPISCLATPVTFWAAQLPRPPRLVWGWSKDGGGGYVWLRSWTLSRLHHFQTVCSVVPRHSVKTYAESLLG
mgnify:CR=1 FL=1